MEVNRPLISTEPRKHSKEKYKDTLSAWSKKYKNFPLSDLRQTENMVKSDPNLNGSNILMRSKNKDVSVNLSKILSIKEENETKTKKTAPRNEVSLAELFNQMDRNFKVRTVSDI